MECRQCGYNNIDWSATCSNCGKDFKEDNEQAVEKEDQALSEQVTEQNNSLYPYPGSIKYLKNLMADKEEHSRRIWTLYLGIMALIIIFSSDNLSKYSKNIILSGFYLFLISFIITFVINMISAKNYYSIPMSKNKKNMHRCIFCGHDKIHKTYILNTPLCSHHCEQCEELLFYKWNHIKSKPNT